MQTFLASAGPVRGLDTIVGAYPGFPSVTLGFIPAPPPEAFTASA